MPLQRIYSWQAYDNEQQLIKGELLATSIHSIKYQLITQGLMPVSVKAGPIWSDKHWSLSALVIVTRQLATMLQAGLPLVNSLQLIAQNHPKPQWRYLITQLQQQVEQGIPFSDVIKQYHSVFPPLFSQLIYTGELTGSLDICCLKLVEEQEKLLKQQAKIKKALRYPVFILCVAVIVMLLMLLLVLPEFAEIYSSFDAELPAFTQMVINLSELIMEYGVSFVVLITMTGLGYRYYFRQKTYWQEWEAKCALKLPIIKQILHVYYLARIFQVLSMMQQAGIVLSESLNAVANTTNHHLYRRALLDIKYKIEQGTPFHQAISECHYFSELSHQLIQIGEESGSLDSMLQKLADIYEQQVDETTEACTQILEPVLMLILAGIVGSLVIAMYLPIFQLGNIMS